MLMYQTYCFIEIHVCFKIHKLVLMQLCHFNKVTSRLLKWASTITNPRLFILLVRTTIRTACTEPIILHLLFLIPWRRIRTLLVLVFVKITWLVHWLNQWSHTILQLLLFVLGNESTELRLSRLCYLWGPFWSSFK